MPSHGGLGLEVGQKGGEGVGAGGPAGAGAAGAGEPKGPNWLPARNLHVAPAVEGESGVSKYRTFPLKNRDFQVSKPSTQNKTSLRFV